MIFKNITILDENLEVAENMYVATKGGKIAYIGKKEPEEDYGEAYDGKDKVLMTGLFNLHTHVPMTLLRGYAENKKLQDWLFAKIFPFEGKMNKTDVYFASLLGMAEMIRFGTIAITDMYFHTEEIIKAALECGIKLNICEGTTAFEDGPLKENKNFKLELENYKLYNLAGDGRIKADMSVHAEYTTNERIVRELAEYCDGKMGMQLHLSETKKEVEECKERHGGLTPVQYFERCGLFKNRVTAAHCVWLEEDDFEIMAERKVNVAHCPISNMKLASGVANIPKMLDLGVNVGIGTDGTASNNSFDLWEDMKTYALIHKCNTLNPTLITPKQVMEAVTINGAVAQGRSDCGRLKVGNKADLIVLDCNNSRMKPVYNLLNNLVYSFDSSDIVLTMADGRILYQDGEYKTIDIERVMAEIEKSKNRILGELA